jgi:outer membrane protein, multidrug efflux system
VNLFFKNPVVVFLVTILSSCSSMDKVPPVNIEYAPVWEYSAESPTVINIEKQWWTLFESAQLTELIETAQKKNPDVVIAGERVRQAELQMRIANTSLFPSLGLSASSGENKTKVSNGNWSTNESSRIGLTANYEVDLWGGIAATRHAAKANYKAQDFSREATRLSVSAGVAIAWFNYLALQERITTAQKNIAIAERIQNIVDSLYRNGVATTADVAQQRTNLLTQQTALLPLQLQLNQTRAAIALLEGQVPQAYQLADEKFSELQIPTIHAGVPADVLARRPDIARAEAQLQSASANIYAARTAWLPSVELGANMGRSAAELFSLNPAVHAAGWSVSLAQTIFAGGRVTYQVRLTESRRIELLEQYRQIILTVLQEVDDALNRVAIAQQQESNQQNILLQSERSLQLIEVLYREGGTNLLALLDAQRSLFQAQDALVRQRLARLEATVDLYKALGGGWQKI